MDRSTYNFLPKEAVLATMHGKEQALGETFASIGVTLCVPKAFDSDRFGTFSGEIERQGSMQDAARAKLTAAMATTGMSVGLVSEGAYGAHPVIPFAAAGTELLIWRDDENNYEVVEHWFDANPAYDHAQAKNLQEARQFLDRISFPDTAVIVAPASNREAPCGKGLRSMRDVEHAVKTAIDTCIHSMCFLQTDMRAHMNPRRMETIRQLGKKMADRLVCRCHACGTPGWGLLRKDTGLPCKWCGGPSLLVSHEVHGCVACDAINMEPRSDGHTYADPAHCPRCNP